MAEGTQSKEGLFDIMFEELRKTFTGRESTMMGVAIIDTVIPDGVREDKEQLVRHLKYIGEALIETSKKI